MQAKTTEKFIEEAKRIHGNKYNYNKLRYVNNTTKVIIICPKHGEFQQIAKSHLNGNGCLKCKGLAKITTEEFIEKAKKVHGHYDYNKTHYINCRTKIIIICRKHGEFAQNPDSHLRGHGCPRCGCLKTTEKFIEDAKKIHGHKYDYSKVVYIGANEKIEIICKKHGSFKQSPISHIKNKHGCPDCFKRTTKKFIEEAKKVHGHKYDYSKTHYINCRTKVIIICKKHGEFLQLPKNHLLSHGCQRCGGCKRKTTAEFIEDAKRVHDKYDYSKVEYIGDNKKVKIICPKHGEFLQTPNNHLSGKGCLECGKNSKNTEQFIKQAKKVHGNRYDYSQTKYINCRTKIKIICLKHGIFKQIPNNHLNGNNCPKCNKKTISNISQKWLDICNVPLSCREIKIKCGTKTYIVDGYVKNINTVYEFWGDYWHGNPEIFNPKDINKFRKKSFKELYEETIRKKKTLISAGYKIIDIWENDFKKLEN